MPRTTLTIYVTILLCSSLSCICDNRTQQLTTVHRTKRYFTYLPGSAMGVFVAFAIPLELPNQDVLFSYNFEANYNLPSDPSQFDIRPPDDERSFINRTSVYSFIESRLSSFGMDGHECVLKLICQVAKSPLSHNGLVGHLVHALFTPSISQSEDLSAEEKAEEIGKTPDGNCDESFSSCTENLLDRISHLSE